MNPHASLTGPVVSLRPVLFHLYFYPLYSFSPVILKQTPDMSFHLIFEYISLKDKNSFLKEITILLLSHFKNNL